MEILIRTRSLLFKLTEFISLKDLYNVGGTCKTTRLQIRKNSNLWKDIVCKIYPSPFWSEIGLEDEDYLLMALNKEPIETQLKRLYCLYRSKQPISSPKGLGLYLEIITEDLAMPYQKVILTGTIINDQVIFKRPNGQVSFIFRGEMDLWTTTEPYMIDRASKTYSKNYSFSTVLNSKHTRTTIMTVSQREEIEKVLKPMESENLLLAKLTRLKNCRIDTCLEISYKINFNILFDLLVV